MMASHKFYMDGIEIATVFIAKVETDSSRLTPLS